MVKILEYKDFDKISPDDINWNSKEFSSCTFTDITIGIPRVEALFKRCSFNNITCAAGLFESVLFIDCNFNHCEFDSASFPKSRFVDCTFQSCLFTRPNKRTNHPLDKAKLYGCTQHQCEGVDGFI